VQIAAVSLVFIFSVLMSSTSAWADTDPPGRVARLSYLKGDVSMQPGGVDDWTEAKLNRPLTTSDRLWTAKDSRAELQIGNSTLRLNSETSFTLANLDDAALCLVGHSGPPATIVKGQDGKEIVIDTVRPATIARFPWAGHIGLALLPQVVAAIERARTTLVFTNVRSACEAWYHAILEARPHWAGSIAVHHGSLERDVRDWVEDGLTGDDAVEIARAFVDAGADVIHVSTGQTTPAAQPVYGRLYQTPYSDRIRNEARVPTIAVGNVTEPDQVNGIIAAGRADMVALGRPHLSDPHWTLHAATSLGYGGQPWPRQYYLGRVQSEREAERARQMAISNQRKG
jgi:hypothetical protein